VAAQQFVGDERADEIDGGHLVGLCLAQSRFQGVGHVGDAELAKRAIEFDEVHVGSPVFWSMSSLAGELADEAVDLA
jgi:hypothetical protein